MWNRVLLLASGMATGWTLVHYWVAPQDQIKQRATLLALSFALGLVGIGWMAADAAASGVAGALAFAFCALVAYAANARHVDRAPDVPILPKPADPLVRDSRLAVLLVADLEPSVYEGPAFWAGRYRQAAMRGLRAPHWFARPRTYARIRAAYQRMGGRHPAWSVLDQPAQSLAQCLGEGYLVRLVALHTSPTLSATLSELVDLGLTQFILLPLGQVSRGELGEQATHSRVRELGIELRYLSPLDTDHWSLGQPDERLAQLARGQAVRASPAPPRGLDELYARVMQR